MATIRSLPRTSEARNGLDWKLADWLEIRADLPIVMTSGYVRPEDQERALHMGLRDLILKPDTIEQLARTLDQVFSHDSNSAERRSS